MEKIDKKQKHIFYIFLTLNLFVWLPIFVGFRYSQQIRNILPAIFVQAWDKDKPASSTSLRNSNPEMLANQAALETAIAQDHEFSTGGTNSGKHEVITFEEEASAGASSTNEGHLQVIDGGSQPEMAFTSEDGDELQFTKDGDLYSSDNLQIAGTSTFTGASTFNSSITLGAGDDLIGSSTSDITFNTNKFTVAGATGNTLVAGTLTVTGVATLGDSSQMATSAAPTADADLANKKYVDLIAKTLNDSESNALVHTNSYKAQVDGFVSAMNIGTTEATINGYTNTSDNPEGSEANLVAKNKGSPPFIFFPVVKDEYFTVTGSNANRIWWWSRGAASPPVDQD